MSVGKLSIYVFFLLLLKCVTSNSFHLNILKFILTWKNCSCWIKKANETSILFFFCASTYNIKLFGQHSIQILGFHGKFKNSLPIPNNEYIWEKAYTIENVFTFVARKLTTKFYYNLQAKLQMISLKTDNILNTFEDAFKYIICYSEHSCRYSTYTCHCSIAITL